MFLINFPEEIGHFCIFTGPQSQPSELDQTIDYNFAQQELMMNEYSNDPIQEAICDLEKQYEEDKQGEILPYCTIRISDCSIRFSFTYKYHICSVL